MSRVSALDKVDTVDSEIPQYLRLLDELASKVRLRILIRCIGKYMCV